MIPSERDNIAAETGLSGRPGCPNPSVKRSGVTRPEGRGCLVHLCSPPQETPVRVDYGPAKLMEKQPGALIAADAHLRLELERRDAVGMCGQEMRGQEPRPERQVAAVHHRTRRYRGLASAVCALAEETLPLQLPALRAAAG